jgi:hypothetical protein
MITATKEYSENETSKESNGRIYCGVVGWRWYPRVNGELVGDAEGYRTKRDAIKAAVAIAATNTELGRC